LTFGPGVIETSGVQPYSTAHTRELLLQQAPCECRRGVEVTAVLRDRGRVGGVRARPLDGGPEEDVLAEWTVGDDGVFSAVRHGCGLPIAVSHFPLDLLSFGFDWPQALPPDRVRICLNEDRLTSGVLGMPAAPLPGGKGVALIPVWPEAFANVRRLQAALRRFIGRDPVLAEMAGGRTYPGGMTRNRLAWARTPRFGTAGALLMGDAAHPVTPAGGQGANLSVADAVAIAEIAQNNPAGLLADYERRRRPAALRSLSISREAARVFSLPRIVLHLGIAALPWISHLPGLGPGLFGRFLRTAAGAFQDGGAPGR
jgi:2-polyprenyl-6-methoxyphenol hydroxylase-like FAD-dependent oxidoreductase